MTMNRLLSFCTLYVALLIGALGILSSPALAVCGAGAGTCFVVAAGGNSNSTSTWSASSGGATCTCTPATTDAVILDNAAGQLTINAALNIASLDATGTGGSGVAYSNTLSQGVVTLTITGNLFTLVSGMTYIPSAANRAISFTSTSGTTLITTAGKTLGNVTMNGAGGTFRLVDDLSMRTDAVLTLTNGTLDNTTNNRAVNIGALSQGGGTLQCGTNTWTLIAVTGNLWTTPTSGVTCNTGTIRVTPSGTITGIRTMNWAGISYGTITIDPAPSVPLFDISVTVNASTVVSTLNLSGPQTLYFTGNVTWTVTNAPSWSGSQNNWLAISSLQPSTAATTIACTCASGSPTLTWAALTNVHFTGGTPTAANSIDLGGNTGIAITAPSFGGGRIIGG